MKISQLIADLREMQDHHGDIEVTITASALPDNYDTTTGKVVDHPGLASVYESTCETLIVREAGDGLDFKRVRLYL